MAGYVIKRKLFNAPTHRAVSIQRKTKSFGIGDGVGNVMTSAGNLAANVGNTALDVTKQVGGGALETVGKVAQSSPAKFMGGIGGASLGAKIGTAFGGPVGTLVGGALGYALGKKTTKAAGSALQGAGERIQLS